MHMSNFLDFVKSENDHTIRFGKHILQDIFNDWWQPFVTQHSNFFIRPVVLNEISKFISCGSKHNGYAVYECEHCGNYAYVPFTCKSRFCPSCGVNSSINRSHFIPSKCFDVTHRHISFTIPDILWPFFRADRSLLNILFDSASYTLLSWFKQQSKLELFTPGIIATLHTFGRDLKWNTHIHILVTEGAMGRNSAWKAFTHFPYNMLRKRFMTKLLFELSKFIKSSQFKKIKNDLYLQKGHGFYVHAPKRCFSNTQIALNYTTRYLGRPPIAESRILAYDGTFVTFFYNRHEDNVRVEEKVHAFDFIKRLIIHIPQKGFHMIRYYGLYAMKKTKTSHLKRIKDKLVKPLKWLDKLLFHFKCNPLKCTCGNTLKFSYVVESHFSQNFQLPGAHLT